MAKPGQSHNLQIRIGTMKPGSGQAQNIATGNSGSGTSHNQNYNPAPGSAAHGPRQDGNQGSSLQGSKPGQPAKAPGVTQGNLTRGARGRRPS